MVRWGPELTSCRTPQAPHVNVNGLGPVSVHVLHGTGAVAAKPLVLLVDDCRGLYYVTISHILGSITIITIHDGNPVRNQPL